MHTLKSQSDQVTKVAVLNPSRTSFTTNLCSSFTRPSHLSNKMRHVEIGAASSTEDCSIPVNFVQKSLSLGLSVGITNCLNSDRMENSGLAEISTAGNSMISGGEASGSPLFQHVDSKSTTMRKSNIWFFSALHSPYRFFAYRVTIAPCFLARAIVFTDIILL